MGQAGEENTCKNTCEKACEKACVENSAECKDGWVKGALGRIAGKMALVRERNAGKIPYTTDEKGAYVDLADPNVDFPMDGGINWWTNGFWGGLLWLLYTYTGEERYGELASHSGDQLEACFEMFYGIHHDVGFMYLPTAVMDYRLKGNPEGRKRGMHAANLLAGRYNLAGAYIRAWNENYDGDARGRAIIDCMMNLNLLYWAGEEDQDPRFRHIALSHADTARKYFVREDGSVRHIIDFDPETGAYLGESGGQGWSEGSSWTRGQAWAIYGFTTSYAHTGRKEYLETAQKVADYCLSSIPEDGIIPVDFRQPARPAWEDSCGAVIMASGLLELAEILDKTEAPYKTETSDRTEASDDRERLDRAGLYRQSAEKILRTIYEKRTDFSWETDAIVRNCSASYHNKDHHFAMVYADYFFVEGLLKLVGANPRVW